MSREHGRRRGARPEVSAAVLIAVAAVATPACNVSMPRAAAITITSPTAMADADLPLEIRWEAAEQPEGGFAVFVDRAPIAPGRNMRTLANRERDNACLARPECPDDAWLRARRVYVSDSTAVTIEAVADAGRDDDVHRITVVPLDAEGRRSSDAGAFIEVVVSRDG